MRSCSTAGRRAGGSSRSVPGAITLASAEGAKHELPLDAGFQADSRGSRLGRGDRSFDDHSSRGRLPDAGDDRDCDRKRRLDVQSDALGKLAVPLDSLLGWIMAVPAETDALDALWDRVRLEPRKEEVVWLSNGDRLSGGFLGWDERKIKIQVNGKPLEVDRTGIVAVGFDPALVNYPRPKSEFLELTLKDGTQAGRHECEDRREQRRGDHPFRTEDPISLERAGARAREKPVVRLSHREKAGPGRVLSLRRTDPRVSRRSNGRRPSVSSSPGRPSTAESARRAAPCWRTGSKPGDRRFQALVGVDERAGPAGQRRLSRAGGSTRSDSRARRFRIVTRPSRSTWMSRVESS